MFKVVIITSGQPTANPRVVKEATALSDAGNDVTVIYVPISPWTDQYDAELFSSTPLIKWKRVGYHPNYQINKYRFIRLRRKLVGVLQNYFPFISIPVEYSYVLYAQELKNEAVKLKADLYIAHNLGAVGAAIHAAKKWNAKCAFDAEDFHRGEGVLGSLQNKQAIAIEEKYFHRLSYLTTASPLITKKYKGLFSPLKIYTINNVFSKSFSPAIGREQDSELKLFWFSQTIGSNRGIEVIIEAMNLLKDLNLSLHLLGDCKSEFKMSLIAKLKGNQKLVFYKPVALADVFDVASQFDIGMASEIPYCVNRDICLTNKIFTYITAGICILASDTKSQKDFIEKYPGVGKNYKHNDPVDLSQKIRYYYDNKTLLQASKKESLQLAQTELNWEVESKKLLNIVNPLISRLEENPHYIPTLSPI